MTNDTSLQIDRSRSKRNKSFVSVALGLSVLTLLTVAGSRDSAPGVAPPNSNAYGKTLPQWLSTYWRWYYSGGDPTQSKVGNVLLMALPAGEYVSGDGTPASPAIFHGELNLTISDGTPFVLPAAAWVGERYLGYPGVPDDLPIADDVFLANIRPVLTIDGKAVLSDANQAAFYVPPTAFNPIVTYPAPTSYGSVAAVFFQGIGIVSKPLSLGKHVIHLYEPFVIPAGIYAALPDGLGVIYDNTWNITVVSE